MKSFRSNTGRFLTAAALVTPVLAVQGLRLILGPSAGPATSSAGVVQPPPAVPQTDAPAQKPLTDQQKHAARWAAALDRTKSVTSPMLHVIARPADPVPTNITITTPDNHAAGPIRPIADLSLGAIMGSPESALALIGGKVRRVGAQVEPGWTIKAISVRDQTVLIEGPGGATVELHNTREPKLQN